MGVWGVVTCAPAPWANGWLVANCELAADALGGADCILPYGDARVAAEDGSGR